jgi:predicted permease
VPGPFRGYVGVFVGTLQVLVVLMLVIACANAANLALAQAASRRREMAVRTSLGASRGRLLQQMLTETVILAAIAGAGGLLAAHVAAPALLRLMPRTLPLRLSLATDWRVMVFAAILALVSGVALGWVPALRATSDLMSVIKGEATSGRRRSRLRNTLVVVQVAVSLVLLIAGALCWRSLAHARSVDPGFATDHRVFVKLDLKTLGYADSAGRAFYRTLLARAGAAPGVISASTASYLPLETTSLTVDVDIAGRVSLPGQRGFSVQAIDVGPGFFKTAGTPIVRGLEFDVRDGPGAASVAMVNEAMAERFWPGQDAIGRMLSIGTGKDRTDYRIVGVVRTGKYRTLGERPRPVLFRSLLQHYQPRSVLLVHSSAPAGAALQAIRDEIAGIDPNLVVIEAVSLDEQLALALFPTRVAGTLLSVIGATGLCLALAGLAGLVAYSVASRTREIGIRMALGARRGEVVAHFVREGARLLLIGAVIGSAAAVGAARALSAILLGTGSADPMTFIGVIALMITAALGACWFAARRAAMIDPMTALRRD